MECVRAIRKRGGEIEQVWVHLAASHLVEPQLPLILPLPVLIALLQSVSPRVHRLLINNVILLENVIFCLSVAPSRDVFEELS